MVDIISTSPFYEKHTGDWNTGQDSLKQLATLEWNIDMGYMDALEEIRSGQKPMTLHELYDYMIIYYDRLRSCMYLYLQQQCDKDELLLENLYNSWKNNSPDEVPMRLLQAMRQFKRKLYDIKQKTLRIGIPMKKEMTNEEKVDKAFE